MIFHGGMGAYVVKAVINHVFNKNGKIFEMNLAEWNDWIEKNPTQSTTDLNQISTSNI